MTIHTASAIVADTAAHAITYVINHASVDYRLFQTINGLAGTNRALDASMIACAKYSPIIFALVLIGLWLTWTYRNQRGAALAGISGVIALGIGQIVGAALPRDRPYLAHHATLLITHSPDTSFPSDHATLAFAVGVMVWQFNRRLGTTLLLFGAVTAFARVFVGAHYPSDVLGGAVLGSVVSLVIATLSRGPTPSALLDRVFTILARCHLAAPAARTASLSGNLP